MLQIFSPIQKRLSKLLKYQEITNDSWLFRLHCVWTVAMLMGASVMLTSVQLIGRPIACTTSGNPDNKDLNKMIETFCWVNSTYLMPPGMQEQDMREPSSYFDLLVQTHKPRRYYTYYQWVCFALFLQGILCYLPKCFWKLYECDLLGKLLAGLQNVLIQQDEVDKGTDAIICYLKRHRNQHKFYPMMYWFCEGLCLLNMVVQMVLMNQLFGGNFFSIGTEALKNSNLVQYERTDHLIYIFPRITKCDFYTYGPSGTIVNTDTLCILPQNFINEKNQDLRLKDVKQFNFIFICMAVGCLIIYIYLWFWYVVLTALFACLMVYRGVLIFLPSIRPWLLVIMANQYVSKKCATEVTSGLDLGDWWLVYMLAKNMKPLAYRDMLAEYSRREKNIVNI